MSNKYLLSICIPTYNFGKYIDKTIQSIIKQKDFLSGDIEIIIGDGGSDDDTYEIIRPFLKRFKVIKYINFKKKSGVDKDIIKTVQFSSGKYCWLFSADDVMTSNSIKHVIDTIKLNSVNHSEKLIFLFNRYIIDKNNNIQHDIWGRCEKGIYNFSHHKSLSTYLKKTKSLGGLFSFISVIVFNKSVWNDSIKNLNKKVFFKDILKTNYAHAFFLINSLLSVKSILVYSTKRVVIARTGNDSFAKKGILKRYLIDLEGFRFLSEVFFKKNKNLLIYIKKIMRKTRPHHTYINLLSTINFSKEKRLAELLNYFGYNISYLFIISFFSKFSSFVKLSFYFEKLLLKKKIIFDIFKIKNKK